jgi:hypothetical protein
VDLNVTAESPSGVRSRSRYMNVSFVAFQHGLPSQVPPPGAVAFSKSAGASVETSKAHSV